MASGKKKPAWLTGEPEEDRVVGQQTPRAGSRKGPLSEDDTGNLLTAENVRTAVAEEREANAQTQTVPRVGMPEAGGSGPDRRPAGGNSVREILQRLRDDPLPLLGAVLALAVLIGVLVIIFGGDGGDSRTADRAPSEGANTAQRVPADPFAGGPVSDSGVVFEPLQESGDSAALSGAGLEWSGSVTEKEGGRGQTLTLDGPTAAQLERGFDVGGWDVEPGVYAVAQRDSGEVLHVTTQTLVPQDRARAAEEMTLGTVYTFRDDEFSGFAYYLDRREEGSDRVTRTYVRPGREPYRVGYDAPASEAEDGDRNGAFVPLLVGWRGFEDPQTAGGE